MNIMLLNTTLSSIPITDPVMKFLIILIIILLMPILLEKIKIPQILGLIIAGAIVGPHGFNLIMRDSGIILSGTAGLLYIMFLAGLEIDINDFKKNSIKSLCFGMYTFLIPMIIGTFTGVYILHFSWMTSILLASMFASHTLITYPIVSKMGISRNSAVGITVGGTMVTDVLALLVLTVIVGMTEGDVNQAFWIRLAISVLVFAAFVLFIFPLISRWFFKQVSDAISQYIYVLAMVFFAAFLAQLAGMEGIIGAFLAGLAMNRLIPRSSPLMNRVEFVGNAIFIPFFLISVGMLIDYKAFFTDTETILVGIVMIIVATACKFIASWMTQKTYGMSVDQRNIIFGLSNAQAAATLAAVLVGYNIIIGETPDGQPIRLLNESVLNGTILMILVTCTIASVVTQRSAARLAIENKDEDYDNSIKRKHEHILIPISNNNTIEELVNLSLAIKSKNNRDGLYALKVINSNESDEKEVKESRKLLDTAVHTAAAADIHMQDLIRYDFNTVNAVTSVICENNITDIVLGLHRKKNNTLPSDFLGRITDGILCSNGINTFVYKPVQPLATVKRNLIVLPHGAENETGFVSTMNKLHNVIYNTGVETICFCDSETQNAIEKLWEKDKGKYQCKKFDNWEDFLIIFREARNNDCMWVFMSRKEGISYHPTMPKIPRYLNKYFIDNNFVLIYPQQ